MRLLPKPLEGWLDCLLTPALKFLTLNENVYYSSNKAQVMLTRLSGDHPLRTTIAHGVAIFLLPSWSPIFMKREVMMEDRWAATSYTEGILINIQMVWAKVDMDLGENYKGTGWPWWASSVALMADRNHSAQPFWWRDGSQNIPIDILSASASWHNWNYSYSLLLPFGCMSPWSVICLACAADSQRCELDGFYLEEILTPSRLMGRRGWVWWGHYAAVVLKGWPLDQSY